MSAGRLSILTSLAALATCAILAPLAHGATIFVKADAAGANNGTSWADAFTQVQPALNAATTGDEIWVAAGTYVENITLKLGVALYGGFAGNETDLAQRDWTTNKSILDGNKAGSVVTSPSGATETTRIDGFTIRNGAGTSSGPDWCGAGIYCASSSPTIANNVITANPLVTFCNKWYPGAIHCDASSPRILSNTIVRNTGNGIICVNASAPLITGNTISENAFSGIVCSASSPTIESNFITGNTSGGIRCEEHCSPQILNNTISGNSAYAGGGIRWLYSSTPTVSHNTITGNMAHGASDGSSAFGGGIHCSDSGTITNNMIVGNTARSDLGGANACGGGIYCSGSLDGSLTVANNTIASNIANAGGGIYWAGGPGIVTNTVVAFNSSGICVKTASDSPALRYNCVFGNVAYSYAGVANPTGANGNIATDPQLADLAHGNAHILPDSPCMDTGDDSVVQPGSLDVDGQSRILGSHVDIGADESDGTTWPKGPYLIVRVSLDGDDANDGSSWAKAKRTVQTGIDASLVAGGEVWVKAGTYPERITLRVFAHVYGGFSGAEEVRTQRDFRANATILDGQQGNSVVTASGITPGLSTIDGFTITNAMAMRGGGIACFASSPTIANNTIVGNRASGEGGGIYCIDSSCPTILNNTISGNTAGYGGGIYCGYNSNSTIADNVITKNTASMYGGGIYCPSYSAPMITSNAISGNGATYGGGIRCYTSSAIVVNNWISTNKALMGGGIDVYGGAVTFANNAVTGNTASSDAGGIYFAASSLAITNTIVAFNSSGIYGSGSTATLRYNCVFGNTAYNYRVMPDQTGINGNVSLDPLFVRPASPGPDGQWGTADDDYGDLRLRAGSPCIDAGDNAAVPADIFDLDGDGDVAEPMPFDLAGLARFRDDPLMVDTGLGAPPIVDMGAYEYFDAVAPTLMWTVSRKTHGAAGDFDVIVPNPPGTMPNDIECRKDGPTKVILVFSEDVMAADGVPDATEVALSAGALGAVSIAGGQMTMNMSGVPDMTCLTITLSGITDLAGNALTGDNTARIRVLLGDTNSTGSVSVADVNQTRSRSGQTVDAFNFRSDTNCTGSVSVADVNQVRSRSGNSVTCP